MSNYTFTCGAMPLEQWTLNSYQVFVLFFCNLPLPVVKFLWGVCRHTAVLSTALLIESAQLGTINMQPQQTW